MMRRFFKLALVTLFIITSKAQDYCNAFYTTYGDFEQGYVCDVIQTRISNNCTLIFASLYATFGLAQDPITLDYYLVGTTTGADPEAVRGLYTFDQSSINGFGDLGPFFGPTNIATYTSVSELLAGITFGGCDTSDSTTTTLYGILDENAGTTALTIVEIDTNDGAQTQLASIPAALGTDSGGRSIAYSPWTEKLYTVRLSADDNGWDVIEIDPNSGAYEVKITHTTSFTGYLAIGAVTSDALLLIDDDYQLWYVPIEEFGDGSNLMQMWELDNYWNYKGLLCNKLYTEYECNIIVPCYDPLVDAEIKEQCKGESIDGNIDCAGYASCADAQFDVSGSDVEILCEGGASCANIATAEGEFMSSLECSGYMSCANIVDADFSNHSEIYVSGSFGFANSVVTSSVGSSTSEITMECDSYAGFANVYAMDSNVFVSNVDSSAYFCFYNASVRMANNSEISLNGRLAGYKGYFYCGEEFYCNIDCNRHPTACYDVTFDCDTPERCTVAGCNETEGIWCPNDWWDQISDNSDNSGNNSLEWQYLPVDDRLRPDYFDNWEVFYDSECLDIDSLIPWINESALASDSFKSCDSENGCNNQNISMYQLGIEQDIQALLDGIDSEGELGVSFCIRGFTASAGEKNIIDFGELLDIACDGKESCDDNLYFADNVYGRGEYALENGNCQVYGNDGTGGLSCEGYYACSSIDLVENMDSLYCIGDWSCYVIDSVYNVSNIYAFAEESFVDGAVYSNGDVNNPQILNLYIDTDDQPGYEIRCLGDDTCNVYCFEPSLRCAEQLDWYGCSELDDQFNLLASGTATCNVLEYTWTPTSAPTTIPTNMPTEDPTARPSNEPTTKSPTQIPTAMPVDTVETTQQPTQTPTEPDTIVATNPASSVTYDVTLDLSIEGSFEFDESSTTDDRITTATSILGDAVEYLLDTNNVDYSTIDVDVESASSELVESLVVVYDSSLASTNLVSLVRLNINSAIEAVEEDYGLNFAVTSVSASTVSVVTNNDKNNKKDNESSNDYTVFIAILLVFGGVFVLMILWFLFDYYCTKRKGGTRASVQYGSQNIKKRHLATSTSGTNATNAAGATNAPQTVNTNKPNFLTIQANPGMVEMNSMSGMSGVSDVSGMKGANPIPVGAESPVSVDRSSADFGAVTPLPADTSAANVASKEELAIASNEPDLPGDEPDLPADVGAGGGGSGGAQATNDGVNQPGEG